MILAGLCVTLALAGLELGHRLDRLAVVFALDRSRSVDEGRLGESNAVADTEALDATRAAVAAIRDAVPTMEPGDQAGLVVFGAQATTELLPSPEPPIAIPQASLPRDATDLGAGIRRALALPLPAGCRLPDEPRRTLAEKELSLNGRARRTEMHQMMNDSPSQPGRGEASMDPMDETEETRAKRSAIEGRLAKRRWQHLAIVAGLLLALTALAAVAL